MAHPHQSGTIVLSKHNTDDISGCLGLLLRYCVRIIGEFPRIDRQSVITYNLHKNIVKQKNIVDIIITTGPVCMLL